MTKHTGKVLGKNQICVLKIDGIDEYITVPVALYRQIKKNAVVEIEYEVIEETITKLKIVNINKLADN
ncbi:MAG: hypothetical protein FWE37_01605 [Spirochaetaceae bacterium]|nr:hypothetical protein [Spirochaetaceae bacterium]